MDRRQSAPILVTGAHRTGTTWVGKMLAANRQAAYISEPLNLWHRPGVLRAPLQHWYNYICTENEQSILPALQETLAFRYHPWREIRSLRSAKDALRMARDWGIFTRGRFLAQRPLLKDPFAIFSAPWFHDRLGCQVVITVRHPAAFASSLKRLGWDFDFRHLLDQPLLMRDLLEPYRRQMVAMLSTPGDVIGQASLLWQITYEIASGFCRRYPNFQVVRHEDLSLDPLGGFQSLYRALDLEFTPGAQKAILASSRAGNPGEVSKKAVHAVRLDSRANLENWKRRLEAQEIERVRLLTQATAQHFYPDLAWD
ncbi:MAG: sulfotransferase [Anaerolineales bacterium]